MSRSEEKTDRASSLLRKTRAHTWHPWVQESAEPKKGRRRVESPSTAQGCPSQPALTQPAPLFPGGNESPSLREEARPATASASFRHPSASVPGPDSSNNPWMCPGSSYGTGRCRGTGLELGCQDPAPRKVPAPSQCVTVSRESSKESYMTYPHGHWARGKFLACRRREARNLLPCSSPSWPAY